MKVASMIALGIPLLASATFPSNLTVVSQDGVPIPNVYIAGSKLSDDKATLHAWTDENGNAVVNGKKWEQATIVEAIKPGFYETVGSNPILDGPNHATIKLVAPIRPVSLKPIRHAERFCEHIPLTPTALDWALQDLTCAERDYKAPPWGLTVGSSPNGIQTKQSTLRNPFRLPFRPFPRTHWGFKWSVPGVADKTLKEGRIPPHLAGAARSVSSHRITARGNAAQLCGLLRVRSALPALRSLASDPAAPTPLRLASEHAVEECAGP